MDAATQEYENKLCLAFQAKVCMHTLYYYNLTGLLSLQLLQQIAFPVYVPFYKDITSTQSLNLATRLMCFSDENPLHTKRLKFGSLLILVQALVKYPNLF